MLRWLRVSTAAVGLLLVVLGAAGMLAAPPAAGQTSRATDGPEQWVISDFRARISILPDGRLRVDELFRVDFGTQRRHGILREIPVVFNYDATHERVYPLQVQAVRDAAGRAWPFQVERVGANERIRIGDPEREVAGPQSYEIAYTVAGALNSFADHDELYWNVTGGQWPVYIERASVEVVPPRPGLRRVDCFEGPTGSRDPCQSTLTPAIATFQARRRLGLGSELTVVVAFDKGIVPTPRPNLVEKRTVLTFLGTGPLPVGGAIVVACIAVAWLVRTWWLRGRDRRYTSIYYLTDDPRQETRPLGAGDSIVIEFTPPEGVRAAHAGLLLDEKADPLDTTATIVDLAVRGYLDIRKHESTALGLFTSHDWVLEKRRGGGDKLFPYERRLLDGLFEQGQSVTVSELKKTMRPHLESTRDAIYADGARFKWFAGNPQDARRRWALVGVAVAALGAAAGAVLGIYLRAALIAVPVVAAGLAMVALAPAMSRRTARGSEMLRRVLGFRQYVATAETDRQRFNEEQNLFAEYLPYAIVFGCVDKWARAFAGMDAREAVRSWYAGRDGDFSTEELSRDLHGFSSSVSSAVSSTLGASGGSGFGGGGGAGGGGGGGGGGSW